ncbi:hypothetical protein [Streptomyces sp. WMMC940]|uniref:hypothetical protein n=1 Tax=Streptomyces sp. WMMC940 TaxID=3015153 RepID=UPI0022B6F1DA|nr:hypothetical protein [Streptomyces sp. WMMC940]MCZ7458207.1 hypothetical protein [Streptomyces sp. WMMC940]
MSADRQPAASEEELQNPYTRPGFIASAGVIAVIIALVPVLILTGGGGDPADKSAPAATSSAKGAAPPAGNSASPPGGDGTQQSCPALKDTTADTTSVTDLASIGLTWKRFGPVNLPASRDAGPAIVKGGVARCYAHTPRGALLALANISVRSSNGPDWRSVVAQQVYPDETQEVFEQGVAASRSDQASDFPSSSPSLAGYKLISYTPDTAVIDLAFKNPGGTVLTMVLTARWHEGDWKQQMSVEGQSASVSKRFNTNGYTLFPAG